MNLEFSSLTLHFFCLFFPTRLASEKIYAVFTDYSHDKVAKKILIFKLYLLEIIIMLKSYILSE